MTYPVHPHTKKTDRRISPDIQASARGPQLRPWISMRKAWTTAATTATAEAYRCRERIQRPAQT